MARDRLPHSPAPRSHLPFQKLNYVPFHYPPCRSAKYSCAVSQSMPPTKNSSFELANPTPLITMLYVYPSRRHDLQSAEEVAVEPGVPVHTYLDSFENICGRLLAPAGTVRFTLDTTIQDSGQPDAKAPEAVQHNVEDLPDEALRFLLPSRYCDVDKLNDESWRLFGPTRPVWSRVQTICDWVHNHITFGYHFADPQKSALEVYRDGKGVCRDFMHLAVTFCRCLNIPARYVSRSEEHTPELQSRF